MRLWGTSEMGSFTRCWFEKQWGENVPLEFFEWFIFLFFLSLTGIRTVWVISTESTFRKKGDRVTPMLMVQGNGARTERGASRFLACCCLFLRERRTFSRSCWQMAAGFHAGEQPPCAFWFPVVFFFSSNVTSQMKKFFPREQYQIPCSWYMLLLTCAPWLESLYSGKFLIYVIDLCITMCSMDVGLDFLPLA